MQEKYLPKANNGMELLAHLIEECGETLAAAGKTARFGLSSVNPELPKEQQETNAEWLWRELCDLEGAICRMKQHMSANAQEYLEKPHLSEPPDPQSKSGS
jgi:hypothetical protein